MSFDAYLSESIRVLEQVQFCSESVENVVAILVHTFRSGKKLLVCGNGGSASDALHLTGELVGRFLKNRRALPALSLTCNASSLTAIGNDFGFDDVFSRQVEAYGSEGDVLLGFSTSGTSINVIKAFEKAKSLSLVTVALTGSKMSKLHELSDVSVCVPSLYTPLIQQAHLVIYHYVCGRIEDMLFAHP